MMRCLLMILLVYTWTAPAAEPIEISEGPQRESTPPLLSDDAASCVDVCTLGAISDNGSKVCALWDETAQAWSDTGDGTTSMHNRARLYHMWLRMHMLPAGGVCTGHFTDATYREVERWSSAGDSAIWTGTYLAAEAMRAIVTGSPDAETKVNALVQTLHDWWHVSGDTGYLARYAAPADSDPRVLNMFHPPESRDHLNTIYKGVPWHWRGHVSQDQYQGVMLGYSLAYEATSAPEIKAMIRDDVVTFVEQLMHETPTTVRVKIGDKTAWSVDLEMQYTVFSRSETASGEPEVRIDIADLGDIETWGFLEFDPEFIHRVLEKIPLIGLLSPNLDIPRSGSAMMLASFFQVALQVTHDIPAYAERRQNIAEFYAARIDHWLDLAANPLGHIRQSCGRAYFSFNVQFQPLYNLIRLETDAVVAHRVRQELLNQRLWPDVAEHKNVFFAYIYAAAQAQVTDVQSILTTHNQQLMLFPKAPRISVPWDVSDLYPASAHCTNQSSVAVDLNHRTIEDFTWQRHPWQLSSPGESLTLFPGVDYLVAYWLGRYEGFLQDDAANTCLRWQPRS